MGEVYSIAYEEALVQIHDFNRQQVGGIPALSFLIQPELLRAQLRTSDWKTPLLSCLGSWIMPISRMHKRHCAFASKTLNE